MNLMQFSKALQANLNPSRAREEAVALDNARPPLSHRRVAAMGAMAAIVVGASVLWGVAEAQLSPASEPTSNPAGWAPPTTAAVHVRAMTWLAARKSDEATRGAAERVWAGVKDDATATDRLSAVCATFGLVDARAEKLVRFCAAPRVGIALPEAAWLAEPNVDRFMSANLRLLVGRWLVQESLYDETLAQLAGVKTDEVVDPASLLFCQAVAHHALLHKEEGLKTMDRLLRGRQYGPRRYMALAWLMREDLAAVSDDSLDHIARRMRDVERRLELGRAGPSVRKIEDGVIESLDKLIKKMEDAQGKSQDAAGNLQSSRPAGDSRLMGGSGKGEVTQKDVGSKSGWGNLPPKQRDEALQEVGRQFPSHYRDVIEQYFRKMAAEQP